MTTRWQQYVRNGIAAHAGPVPFALDQWAFLAPVFYAVRRARPGGGRVLDVGCGAGTFTALLAHHGYDVVGVDNDLTIVAYAQQMIDYFRSPARVEHADAFNLSAYHGRFDLALSLGVVEHFEPQVTTELLREQSRCAEAVVVVVPARYTKYTGHVTDERLYSRSQVNELARNAGLDVIESFVFGEVPTAVARNLERALPGVAYRRLKHLLTYAMGICCVGRRR
jgi:SAM-dependent methyltransferase